MVLDFAYDIWGEDRTFTCDDMCGVVDAATPIEPKEILGFNTQAEWLAEQMSRYMKNSDSHTDYPQLCRKFVDKVTPTIESFGFGIENMPSATTAAVQIKDECINGYVLGDCCIDILLNDGTVASFTDTRIDALSKKTFERKLEAIRNGEDEKVAIKNQMRENRQKMNENGGYWVIAAKNAFEKEFVKFSFEQKEVKNILVYSDGFARVFENDNALKEKVLNQQITLKQCVAFQRQSENETKYIKRSDDISAILIEVK